MISLEKPSRYQIINSIKGNMSFKGLFKADLWQDAMYPNKFVLLCYFIIKFSFIKI